MWQAPGGTLSREAGGFIKGKDWDMECKCKAGTYSEHLKRVEEGRAAAHVYRGHYWGPTDYKK